MRNAIVLPGLLALVLSACTSGFDGRYAALDRQGEIATNSEGEPSTILTVDGASASLSTMGDTDMYQATILDKKLHLVRVEGGQPTIVLRKEGDQLVTEGGGRENRLVRL